MAFDFSKLITREVNASVNRGVGSVINTFNSSVNTNLSGFVKKGSEQILDQIGAPSAVRSILRNVNAEVVSAGVASANEVFQGIINGTITNSTLSQFGSLDVVQAALKSGNRTAQNMMNLNSLSGLAKKVGTTSAETTIENTTSPYATDFANTFPPKFKFLFVVEFIFNSPFNSQALFQNSTFHIMVHKFERPKIEVEHDDVNMYNFITQVPKSVKYNPVSFTAYDDATGGTLTTFIEYLRKISPIFRIDASNGTSYENLGGLNFEEDDYQASNFSTIAQGVYAGETALDETTQAASIKTMFKEINVYHITDFGKYVDVYKFFNPKITSISLDEFDMSDSSQGNGVTFEIVYDGFFIDARKRPTDVPRFEDITLGASYHITNRNVQGGEDMRAAQLRQQEEYRRQAQASQEAINRQIILENAQVLTEDDSDYAMEQAIRDAEYAAAAANVNNIQSKPATGIIADFRKVLGI